MKDPYYLPYQVQAREVLSPAYEHLAKINGVVMYNLGRGFASLQEKALAMEFPLERMCKTVFFERRDGRHGLYGAVVPASHNVDEDALTDIAQGRLRVARSLPYGMNHGSCGPFLCVDDARRELVHAIVYDIPVESGEVVEFAPPGRPDVSMQATFEAVLEVVTSHVLVHTPGVYRRSAIRKEKSVKRCALVR